MTARPQSGLVFAARLLATRTSITLDLTALSSHRGLPLGAHLALESEPNLRS